MILTEKEAGAKWCPAAIPTHGTGKGGLGCVGSSCMAWRWGPEPRRGNVRHTHTDQIEEPARPAFVPPSWNWVPYDPAEGDAACWVEDQDSVDQRRTGYCGLVSPTAPQIATAVLDATMG